MSIEREMELTKEHTTENILLYTEWNLGDAMTKPSRVVLHWQRGELVVHTQFGDGSFAYGHYAIYTDFKGRGRDVFAEWSDYHGFRNTHVNPHGRFPK